MLRAPGSFGLVLDLSGVSAFGEGHIQSNPGDNRLPSLILGKAATLNRTP